MPLHSSAPLAATPRAHAIRLQAQRQLMTTRIVGALVGLTLAVSGLVSATSAHASTSSAKSAAASATSATHGTVQSVQPVQVKGKASGGGLVAGAVLGGLVGNQMGKGTGNAVMTVGGAVAGGYAGNEVEKNVKKHTVYKTSVKLDDGSVHDYTISQQFAIGARVTVSGKKLKLAS